MSSPRDAARARAPGPDGTLAGVLRAHTQRLTAAGVPSPEADVRVLAEHATGLSPTALRTATLDDVSAGALEHLDWLVTRRANREPLQLLTGRTGFRHLTLRCRAGVFIPRPETELLAGLAIDHVRGWVAGSPPVVVEPCTGTGAVAIAVATEAPGVQVYATDVNPDAVRLARENAAAHDADIDVRVGDLFAPLDPALAGRIDVLVCNPPYLTPAEAAASEPEVRAFDPLDALVGGIDGHQVVERLLREGLRWVRSGGTLLLEVGDVRAEETAARATAVGWRRTRVHEDLTGRPRFVEGTRP